MKSITGIVLTLSVSCASVSAQSGRRIERPAPTAPTEAQIETVPDFSDSTPRPKRPVSPFPAIRGRSSTRNQKQQPNLPAASEPAPTAEGEEVQKVDTDLVTIPVSVFDRNGLYIPNLRQNDFKVFEDGKEQTITYFGSSDAPFTVVLLIDTSPSTAYRIEEIQDAAIAFVNLLQPQDQVIVVEFDGNVHVLSEATNDRARLTKAIKKADFGYYTSLYDSVDFTLRKRLNAIQGRKAIVLFTDGVDTSSSKSSYDSTLNLAEESESLIFPIYYNTFNDNRQPVYSPWPDQQIILTPSNALEYAVGKKYLEELAAYTGGRVFRPEATPGGLTAAFEGIAEELRRQYNIGYIPAEEGKHGDRKQIKVRVKRPNLVIRARDSYVVGGRELKKGPPTSK